MSVSIRELSIKDQLMLEELLDVMQPGWHDGLGPGASGPMAFIADGHTFALGAYVDQLPAGWAWGQHLRRPDGRSMTYVHQIEVVEDHRRRGIATSLLSAVEMLARSNSSHKMWLYTNADNRVGRALYASTGATETEIGEFVQIWDL